MTNPRSSNLFLNPNRYEIDESFMMKSSILPAVDRQLLQRLPFPSLSANSLLQPKNKDQFGRSQNLKTNASSRYSEKSIRASRFLVNQQNIFSTLQCISDNSNEEIQSVAMGLSCPNTRPEESSECKEMSCKGALLKPKNKRFFDEMSSSASPNKKKSRVLKEDAENNKDVDDKILESTIGLKSYAEVDVLCGRGGGTNIHSGNQYFRSLINHYRRKYLRARKNDKPAISRSIVRSIRKRNGRFLKKDETSGLWFEIGDDGAREKTSQALRQRAPELRRILFENEDAGMHEKEGTTGMPYLQAGDNGVDETKQALQRCQSQLYQNLIQQNKKMNTSIIKASLVDSLPSYSHGTMAQRPYPQMSFTQIQDKIRQETLLLEYLAAKASSLHKNALFPDLSLWTTAALQSQGPNSISNQLA